MYKHKLPFTVCFTAAMFIVFFYCAAEFPIFFNQFASFNPAYASEAAAAQACYANSTSLYYGPGQMEHWIRSGVSYHHVYSGLLKFAFRCVQHHSERFFHGVTVSI